jgi:hypothetical protein
MLYQQQHFSVVSARLTCPMRVSITTAEKKNDEKVENMILPAPRNHLV